MGAGVGAGVGAHEPVLHFKDSESAPHEPPCVAVVVVVRVRFFVPPPHALLQPLQALQALCTQSTGAGVGAGVGGVGYGVGGAMQ